MACFTTGHEYCYTAHGLQGWLHANGAVLLHLLWACLQDIQNPVQVASETCGFLTIVGGTFLLHTTRDLDITLADLVSSCVCLLCLVLPDAYYSEGSRQSTVW